MNERPYHLIETETAEDFMEALSPLRRDPNSRENMIYRGQSDSEWKLTPSLYRKNRNGINASWSSHKVLNYELNILYFFVENIGKINLSDYRTSKLLKSIQKIDKNFENYLKKDKELQSPRTYPFIYRNWPNIEILELMALAQHSGLPTRLLDWTYSPYVAAYFAAFSLTDRSIHHNGKMCVWAINRGYTSDFRRNYKRMRNFSTSICRLEPPFWGSNPNAIAQSGCFLFIKGLTDDNPVKEIHIDDYIASEYGSANNSGKNDQTAFLKITVPTHEAPKILELCNLFGVSQSTLFRTYEGCAEEVKLYLPTACRQLSRMMIEANCTAARKVDFSLS